MSKTKEFGDSIGNDEDNDELMMTLRVLNNNHRKKIEFSSFAIPLPPSFTEIADTEHLSEFTTTDCETDGGFLTEMEGEGGSSRDNHMAQMSRLKPHVKGFLAYDAKYFFPFFTRQMTAEVSLGWLVCFVLMAWPCFLCWR